MGTTIAIQWEKMAIFNLYTGNHFPSVARVCQRQLAFLVALLGEKRLDSVGCLDSQATIFLRMIFSTLNKEQEVNN